VSIEYSFCSLPEFGGIDGVKQASPVARPFVPEESTILQQVVDMRPISLSHESETRLGRFAAEKQSFSEFVQHAVWQPMTAILVSGSNGSDLPDEVIPRPLLWPTV